MKVLFIWPNQGSFGVKPMGISILTSVLEDKGHICDLFDTSFMDFSGSNYNDELTDNGFFKPVEWPYDISKKKVDLEKEIEKKVSEFNPDVFTISALNDEIDLALDINRLIDKYKKPVIWGNKAASSMRIKDYCECNNHYYLEGESIKTLPVLLDAIEKDDKRLLLNTVYTHTDLCDKTPSYFNNLNSLQYLDWSNFDDRHFLKAYDGEVYRGGDHMIGWGCTNSCAYCINESWRELHGGMKGYIRRYGAKRITDELQTLTVMYDLNFWKFHDEDFLLKPIKYLEELAQEYALKVDLSFTCMVNAKSVTERKVELLKNMGCVSVSMGIETGDTVMRRTLNRRETPEDIINAVKILHDYGIRVSTFNMIGLPFEDERTIQATIELNRAAGVKYPNISLFIPLEGTRLYDIAVKYRMYEPGAELRTDKPTLKLNSINEKKIMYYYNNFHHLVTKE